MSHLDLDDEVNPEPLAKMGRRDWLKASVAAGVITLLEVRFQNPLRADVSLQQVPVDLWITLNQDNDVEILFAKAEMGQGIWTTLPMILIDEIGLDPNKVRVRQAPSTPTYTNPAMGLSMTAGSTSVRTQFPILRDAGAKSRLRILRAAARSLNKNLAELDIQNGLIIDSTTNSTHTLSAFLREIDQEPLPMEAPVKSPSSWTRLGKAFPELDAREKSNGLAVFGADIRIKDMVYASIIQNPSYGSILLNADELQSEAKQSHFVQIKNGFAIVGESFWFADQEARRLAPLARYELHPQAADFDNEKLATLHREALDSLLQNPQDPNLEARRRGDPEQVYAQSENKIEAQYSVPFLAHLCMETPTATARTVASPSQPNSLESIEVWAPTQSALFVQRTLAEQFGVPSERVTVHMTRLGGGFGRKAMTDYVVQAVAIAKSIGKPVQLIWSREEDIRHDHYRPSFAARMRAGFSQDGTQIAILGDSSGPSIARSTGRPPQGIDPASIEAFLDDPYDFEHKVIRHHEIFTPVPLGFWRSVGASQNTFFTECFLDEIGFAVGQDPVAFRMSLLPDGRLKNVLRKLDEITEWSLRQGKPLFQNRAWGLALYQGFGSFVGQVVEVSVLQNRVRVHKVWCVVDCGLALNPAGIEAQVQGSIAYGLTAALGHETLFREGRCTQSNFGDMYALSPRDMPEVHLTLIESADDPGGMGEPATPPIAPAVANALFRLTGRRLRTLPLRLPAD